MKPASIILLAAGVVLGIAFGALRIADPGPVRDLRLSYFDYLQRLSPRLLEDLPVRVVDIDEASLSRHGQWPWPRDRLAELQSRLAAAGAAVVVYDVLFSEPDRLSPRRLMDRAEVAETNTPANALPDTDEIFAASLSSVPTVLGTARIPEAGSGPRSKAGLVEIGNAPSGGLPRAAGFTPLAPGLEPVADGVGAISIGALGSSGSVRRLPLFWAGSDGPMPSLSVEALRLATQESTFTLVGAGDLEASIEGLAIGSLFVPTTAQGELWLRYRHDDPSLYLSADTVLSADPADWADQVAGQIILVGTSAAGLLDIRTTALGETVPGVSIHAQAIEQILTEDYLRRGDLVGGIEVLAVFALVVAIAIAMTYSGPLFATTIGLLGIGGVAAGSWLAFAGAGILFDAAYAFVAASVTFAILAAYRLVILDRERRAIRQSFSHYVSPAVLGEVERQGHNLSLGGETRDVTVLFSDIRGFTALTEALSAEDLVSLLNELFDAFGQEIMDERGTIDKFIGDAVMAFWNAPIEIDDHSARAVAAALRMRRALDRFNLGRGLPIKTAIGIATGPASVGNIGSRNRFNYSVVGETVNLAARVENACRYVRADMLITEEVAAAAPDLAYLDAGKLRLKGISEPVRLLCVAGGAEVAIKPEFRDLAAKHKVLSVQLSRGVAPEPELLEAACDLAGSINPDLAAFFTQLQHRGEDYRP